MSVKPGDKVRLIDDDPDLKARHVDRIGREAFVLSTGVPGWASVKLQDKYGDVFYARPSWLRKLNQADTKKETRAVQKQAAKMTEERMKTIMTKQENALPTFESVMTKFYALALLGASQSQGEAYDDARDTCIKLAEQALFEEIKNGVRKETGK